MTRTDQRGEPMAPAENITKPAPAPLALATIVTNGGNATVPCEPVNEWLAITPVFGMDDGGKTLYDGRFTITHLPSGTQMIEGPGCIECCRASGRGLAELDVDWASLTGENGREWSRALPDAVKLQLAHLRAVEWGCDSEPCERVRDDEPAPEAHARQLAQEDS